MTTNSPALNKLCDLLEAEGQECKWVTVWCADKNTIDLALEFETKTSRITVYEKRGKVYATLQTDKEKYEGWGYSGRMKPQELMDSLINQIIG